MKPHSLLLETVRAATSTVSTKYVSLNSFNLYYSYVYATSDTDPFEFHSQDEPEFSKKRKAPKPPSKISSPQFHHQNNQQAIDKESNETAAELQDKQPVADNHLPLVDKPPVVDRQPSVVDKQPSVVDKQPPVVDKQPPVVDKQPSVVDKQPPVVVSRSHSPLAARGPVLVEQSPVVDNPQSPVRDKPPIAVEDRQLLAAESSLIDQLSPVMDVSHDGVDIGHLHGELQHHNNNGDEEVESLAMEADDITPSEHGQIIDQSSEDPLNTGASRSEMASTTESSPRYFNVIVFYFY